MPRAAPWFALGLAVVLAVAAFVAAGKAPGTPPPAPERSLPAPVPQALDRPGPKAAPTPAPSAAVARWIEELKALHAEVLGAEPPIHAPRLSVTKRDRWHARLQRLQEQGELLPGDAPDDARLLRVGRQLLIANLVSALDSSNFSLSPAEIEVAETHAKSLLEDIGAATMAGRTDVGELRRRCETLAKTLRRVPDRASDAPLHRYLTELVEAMSSQIDELSRHPPARASRSK